VLSYQHGTIFQDSDAPSSFLTSAEGLAGAVFAAIGFIAVLPDYIGYGDSTALLHPYVHAATLASATVDMNRAARVFFKEPGINAVTNGQLFLAGYSEGGYRACDAAIVEQSLSAGFLSPLRSQRSPDLSGTTRSILGPAAAARVAGFFSRLDSLPTAEPAVFFSAYAHRASISEEATQNQITTARGTEFPDEHTVQTRVYSELPDDDGRDSAQGAYC
jgi:hypothetical protein